MTLVILAQIAPVWEWPWLARLALSFVIIGVVWLVILGVAALRRK